MPNEMMIREMNEKSYSKKEIECVRKKLKDKYLSTIKFKRLDKKQKDEELTNELVQFLKDMNAEYSVINNIQSTAEELANDSAADMFTNMQFCMDKYNLKIENYVTQLFDAVTDLSKDQGVFIEDTYEYTNRYKNTFFDAFEKNIEGLVNITVSKSLNPKDRFYNMVKIYTFFSVCMANMYKDNINAANAAVSNIELSLFLLNSTARFSGKQVADILNGKISAYSVKKAIDRSLNNALIQNNIFRHLNENLNGTENNTEMFTKQTILNIFIETVKETADTIREFILMGQNHEEQVSEDAPVENTEKIQMLETTIEAYKRAFRTCHLQLPEERTIVMQPVIQETKEPDDEELNKKIADLNAALNELSAQNTKLSKNLEITAEENKKLRELIPDSESEETIPEKEIELPKLDYNKKYVFVMQNRQQFEVEAKLKETFPNCMFVNKAEQMNISMDLAIFMTSYLSHGLYKGIKKYCRDNGINYTHCSNMNHDQIVDTIKNYYYTKK